MQNSCIKIKEEFKSKKANKYLFIQIKRFKQGADGKFYKNYSKVSHPLELDLHRILENPTLPEAYFKEVGED